MIKRIMKYIILIFLTYLAIRIVSFNIMAKKVDNSNANIKNYESQNTYQEQYPLSKYASESFESYPIFREFISDSMYEYEGVVSIGNKVKSVLYLLQNFFNKNYSYNEISENLQFPEENIIVLKENNCEVYEEKSYSCEYEYRGKIPETNEVIVGEVDIFANGQYNLVVSLDDDNGDINEKEARLLADDSIAEELTYFIIEKTQEINGTNMEPNKAAKVYYGNNIEKLAGSISYHSLIAYVLEKKNIDDKKDLYEKVREVNITTDDEDSFYVNRSY